MTLSNSDVAHFQEKGWAVLKGFLSAEELSSFYSDFNRLLLLKAGKTQGELKPLENRVDLELLVDLFKTDRAGLGAVYRSLRHLQSLQKMQLGAKFEEVYRKLFQDIGMINVCPYTGTRIDFLGEEKFLFDWHQDYHYIQLSQDSIVFWIPFTDLDKDGAVELLDGSHLDGLRRAKMLDPMNENKNGAKTLSINHDIDFSKYASSIPSLDVGDMLVFSGLTVHRSVPQKTEPVRVTTQFRMGNFDNEDAIERGWPVGQLEGRAFHMDHAEFVD